MASSVENRMVYSDFHPSTCFFQPSASTQFSPDSPPCYFQEGANNSALIDLFGSEYSLFGVPSTSSPFDLPQTVNVADVPTLESASSSSSLSAATDSKPAVVASAGPRVAAPEPRAAVLEDDFPPLPPTMELVESVRSLPLWVQQLDMMRRLSGWAAFDRDHLYHLSDYARLDARLRLLGLGRKYTRLDGNCMCHALEDQCAPGRDDSKFGLRLEAVRWLRHHPYDKVLNGASFADLMPDPAARERHCKRLGNVRDIDRIEFADQYLLVAAAQHRQRNVIVVLDTPGTFFQPIVVAPGLPWIWLALHDNVHYESLVRLDSAAGLDIISGDPKQRLSRKRPRPSYAVDTFDDDDRAATDDGDDHPPTLRRRETRSKAAGGKKKPATKKSLTPPPPVEPAVLYVDSVLDMKLTLDLPGNQLLPLYLVRWSGFADDQNTWEPRESFESLYHIEDFYLRCADSAGRLPYVPSQDDMRAVPHAAVPPGCWRAVADTYDALHENEYGRIDAVGLSIGAWSSRQAGAQLWAGMFIQQRQLWWCFKGSDPTRYVIIQFDDIVKLRYGPVAGTGRKPGDLLPAGMPHSSEQLRLLQTQVDACHDAGLGAGGSHQHAPGAGGPHQHVPTAASPQSGAPRPDAAPSLQQASASASGPASALASGPASAGVGSAAAASVGGQPLVELELELKAPAACYVHRPNRGRLSPVSTFEGLGGEGCLRHRLVASAADMRRLLLTMFVSSYRLHALTGASFIAPPSLDF
eukprot:TRINITY_DN2522_c0_g1_i1.p1 TRINITY_DN2522_c0_g1~~TRINITY_DN2522_c0_g1_i1.p1  ORF type:complete len:751 (+),score=265.00 TRINITY_DN2522_c0_g1_i1:183-2435(+)